MGTVRPYIEELSREECRQLLPQSPVGWIAHCSAGGGLRPLEGRSAAAGLETHSYTRSSDGTHSQPPPPTPA